MAKVQWLRPMPSPDEDERIVASSLMLAILRKTGTLTLADLDKAIRRGDSLVREKLSTIQLTDKQVGILSRQRIAASYTRVKPTVSIITCSECGEWLSSASAVTRCQMTTGCPGRKEAIVKAAVAKLTDDEDQT